MVKPGNFNTYPTIRFQCQDISESYGQTQSFQYFCKHDLDSYWTEVVTNLVHTIRPVFELKQGMSMASVCPFKSIMLYGCVYN